MGIRVVIPGKLQDRVLEELHEGHLGVVRIKALARSYVWWPNISGQLEDLAKGCDGCQFNQRMPTKAPLHPWEWTTAPWQRLHNDYAGPFQNSMFLVVVDAHSKWPEVIPMSSITTSKTIEVLRDLFARFGIPEQIVSDTGHQFASEKFQAFIKSMAFAISHQHHPRGGGGTLYNGLYGEAPPERGAFFRLQVYKRTRISLVEVYKRVGKSVI